MYSAPPGFQPFVILVRSDSQEDQTCFPPSSTFHQEPAPEEDDPKDRWTDEEWEQLYDEMRKGQDFDL